MKPIHALLTLAPLVAACGTNPAATAPAATAPVTASVVVYRSPTCGCCTSWEDHLRAHGHTVESRPTSDMASVKAARGVPGELASCHTAVVDGYFVEGHVPAEAIDRLLRERPDAIGLAVPGMPAGSPGMEVPGRSDPYDVLLVKADGSTTVF